MNGVWSSFVSAMTQTPASGPRVLVTTPPMNPSAGRRVSCAFATQHKTAAVSDRNEGARYDRRDRGSSYSCVSSLLKRVVVLGRATLRRP